MPQLDATTFAAQIVWLAITFVVLYLIMSQVVIPRIGGILEDREARIRGDLDKAQALKADTDAAIAHYEKRLAEARANAQAIVGEMKDKMTAETNERRRKIESELSERQALAEEQIAAQRASALASLDELAQAVTSALVEKLSGGSADSGRVADAVAASKGGR